MQPSVLPHPALGQAGGGGKASEGRSADQSQVDRLLAVIQLMRDENEGLLQVRPSAPHVQCGAGKQHL